MSNPMDRWHALYNERVMNSIKGPVDEYFDILGLLRITTEKVEEAAKVQRDYERKLLEKDTKITRLKEMLEWLLCKNIQKEQVDEMIRDLESEKKKGLPMDGNHQGRTQKQSRTNSQDFSSLTTNNVSTVQEPPKTPNHDSRASKENENIHQVFPESPVEIITDSPLKERVLNKMHFKTPTPVCSSKASFQFPAKRPRTTSSLFKEKEENILVGAATSSEQMNPNVRPNTITKNGKAGTAVPSKSAWKLVGGEVHMREGKFVRQKKLSIARKSQIVDISHFPHPGSSNSSAVPCDSSNIAIKPDPDAPFRPLATSTPFSESFTEKSNMQQESEIVFNPTSTSTQLSVPSTSKGCQMDKTIIKKDYVYKEDVVRGKERENLPAWDCEDCRKYYDLCGKSDGLMKVQSCSKHRSKHPPKRPKTPPGFWDVDIPSLNDYLDIED